MHWKNEPLKIKIGNLSDIARPFRIEELKTLVLKDESKIQIGKHYG